MAGHSESQLLNDDEGYDSDLFVDKEKAREFRCSICTCITRDPAETEPCGHLFCKSCLETFLECRLSDYKPESNLNCANCRAKIESTTESKWVRRQVGNLKIKCPNHNAGCKWISELCFFRDHIINDCQYIIELCKYCQNNNNKTEYFRKDKELHYNKCIYYPITCNLCKINMKRGELSNHLKNECEMKEIECPQLCGNKHIISKYLDKHIKNECIKTIINCPYTKYGCKLNIQRKEQRSHLINYQVLHLELKVVYLERLAKSPEMLSLINTTGKMPEVGGLYYREDSPYDGFPCYRHDMNKTFIIRFDRKLPGWVLDTNNFDGDIIASRRGYYISPASNCDSIETKESQIMYETLFQDLESNVNNEDNDNDDNDDIDDNDSLVKIMGHNNKNSIDSKHSSDMELDEKQIILQQTPRIVDKIEPNDNSDNNRNNAEKSDSNIISTHHNNANNDKKPNDLEPQEDDLKNEIDENTFVVYSGSVDILQKNKINDEQNNESNDKNIDPNVIYNDGQWHLFAAKANKSKLIINGYSQKEWDLEWELKSMKASLNLQPQRATPGSSGGSKSVGSIKGISRGKLLCKCGKPFEETTVLMAWGHTDGVICNICEKSLNNKIFHCIGGSSIDHLNGSDLCLDCGKAKYKTQKLKRVPCICRQIMAPMFAKKAYNFTSSIRCNDCHKEFIGDDIIWHCQQKRCDKHKQGYDLCIECGKKVAADESGPASILKKFGDWF